MFFAVLEDVVRQARKIRGVIIRAPSTLAYIRDEPVVARSLIVPGTTTGGTEWEGLLRADLEHLQSDEAAWPVRKFISRLVNRAQVALPHLEMLRILGFANSNWQSSLASSEWILNEVAYFPALQDLTTLDLQLEMFPHDDNRCMLSLAKIMGRNPKLEVLRIRSGPNVDEDYRISTENWAPLLLCLGDNPPFRLRTLEIDGLVTSRTAPTLDQIVKAHSPTLSRLVLEHTNFHFPNTLRAFFYALADSNLNYYQSTWLYLHQRTMLVASTLSFLHVADEVLRRTHHRAIGKDEGYSGWVHITWDVSSEDTPLVYQNLDGWYGEDWMRNCFLSTISSLNSGAIRDS